MIRDLEGATARGPLQRFQGENLPEITQNSQTISDLAKFEFEALSTLYNALPDELQDELRSALGGLPSGTSLEEAVNRPTVFDVLDQALNLSNGSGSLIGTISQMGKEDMESALKALADLLRHGVVGYEYREVNGSPQKVFIDVAIGSDLHRAPLIRGARFDSLI